LSLRLTDQPAADAGPADPASTQFPVA